MKNRDLYNALLSDVHAKFNIYNSKPDFFTEEALWKAILDYNLLVKRLGLEPISWKREDNSNYYQTIAVMYIHFGDFTD